MTPEEQVSKNLEHAFEFLREGLKNPSLLDQFPNQVNVMLCPADDPELTQANLGVVQRDLARHGATLAPHVEGEHRQAGDSTLVVPV